MVSPWSLRREDAQMQSLTVEQELPSSEQYRAVSLGNGAVVGNGVGGFVGDGVAGAGESRHRP